MKATELLKDQHAEVKDLFRRLEKTEDGTDRREILDTIAESLHGHMVIEEEIFYPAVRGGVQSKKTEEMVPEAYEEHHVVKLLLAELPDIDPEDERFAAKMTVLEELIDHHVREEEKELFKAAEKLGKPQLEQLAAEMCERLRSEQGEDGDELGATPRSHSDADDEPYADTSESRPGQGPSRHR
jgi:iron-sulfur cluster repair protein YtfE (RIC family)